MANADEVAKEKRSKGKRVLVMDDVGEATRSNAGIFFLILVSFGF